MRQKKKKKKKIHGHLSSAKSGQMKSAVTQIFNFYNYFSLFIYNKKDSG